MYQYLIDEFSKKKDAELEVELRKLVEGLGATLLFVDFETQEVAIDVEECEMEDIFNEVADLISTRLSQKLEALDNPLLLASLISEDLSKK